MREPCEVRDQPEGTEQNDDDLHGKESDNPTNSPFSFQRSKFKTEDPMYPGEKSSPASMAKYRKPLGDYNQSMFKAFEECEALGLTGKRLWEEAQTTWSSHSIQYMSDNAVLKLRVMLLKGGVYVACEPGQSKREPIWIWFKSKEFPQPKDNGKNPTDLPKEENSVKEEEPRNKRATDDFIRGGEINASEDFGPGESRNFIAENSFKRKSNSYAMSTLMKSYNGRPLFGGDYGDNSAEAIKLYDTLCAVSGVEDDEDKLRCIPIVLKSSALKYFNSNLWDCTSYPDCVNG